MYDLHDTPIEQVTPLQKIEKEITLLEDCSCILVPNLAGRFAKCIQ